MANLDQSQFTENSDTYTSRGDGIVVLGTINTLGGDDRIERYPVEDSSSQEGVSIESSSLLDGGSGFNYLQSYGWFSSTNIGIAVRGILKNFQGILGIGSDSGVVNLGSIAISDPSTAGAGLGTSSITGAGDSGAGVENFGLISGGNASLNIVGTSTDSSGIFNSGSIITGRSSDKIFGISNEDVGLTLTEASVIETAGGNDEIASNSILNYGSIDLGDGADVLRINATSSYFSPTSSNAVRGSGRIDLGKGNDRLIFGGLVQGSAYGSVGNVSGGAGKRDRLVIEEGQFRFAKLSGGKYRIFDANDNIVADVAGFELVETQDGVRKISEGTFGQLSDFDQNVAF